jgi:YVTN family beta-propeller protein
VNSPLRLAIPLVVLVAASAAPAADGPAALLLALNKGDHTLAIVDAATLQVLGRAPSGPDPHEVVGSADGTLAYISNYTAGNGFANSLSVVDLAARKPLAPIDLGSMSRPHGLALAGGKVYFTAEGSRSIGRYDPATHKVDWTLGTGQDGTHMIIASRDVKRLFTSNLGSASVCVIEQRAADAPPPRRESGTETAAAQGQSGAEVPKTQKQSGPGGPPPQGDWSVTVVPVGRGAEGFDLSPDGKELWVANAQDGTVSIIDTTSRQVTLTVNVPFRRANRLKFTPDGTRVLISDLGGPELFVLDAASHAIVKRVELGAGAAGIQMAPDGSRAFASVGSRNSVAVVDLKTLTVSARIETGPGPDGLAWVTLR